MIPRPALRRSGLVLLLALLAAAVCGPIVHDHWADEAAVYDEHCPLLTLALRSVGVTLPDAPGAPQPLPGVDPVALAGAGLVMPPALVVRSARAPPSPTRVALES